MTIESALEVAVRWGGIDGDHHKAWVIDQMVRCLTNCPTVSVGTAEVNGIFHNFNYLGESEQYKKLVADACNGEDGPNTYDWNKGTAP